MAPSVREAVVFLVEHIKATGRECTPEILSVVTVEEIERLEGKISANSLNALIGVAAGLCVIAMDQAERNVRLQ